MSANSKIEWTEATWNPVTGCTKISAGCQNCYAERTARRLQGMGQPKYGNGFEVTLHRNELSVPHRWRKPRKVFVCSMGDLFHVSVPLSFIEEVFMVMEDAPQHLFQVLTKRAFIMSSYKWLEWPRNVWAGVTVENADYTRRIDYLRRVPAAVRFLSLEPLLGPLSDLDLTDIHWVIVGGESGPGARPMKAEWVREIRDQCIAAGVPFFFKQWGGVNKKKAGRVLDGRTWDEMPEGGK